MTWEIGMAIVVPMVKKTVEAKVLAAFQAEFGQLQGENSKAMESWQKQAKIAGEIAGAIMEILMTQAEVSPGIPVATPVGPGATTGPGKIL
jgi:hypothetical protein